MNTFSFDHAVLVVSDLDAATRDYTQLGFTVEAGGQHSGGWTHNALVGLGDGSYLELIATVEARHTQLLRVVQAAGAIELWKPDFQPVQQRFLESMALGDGFADFALVASDLEAQIAAARERGLALLGPLGGGRQRPDGERLAWRFGLPPDARLPFLIDDVTPRRRRVPVAPRGGHANGVTGVASVVVAVADLNAGRARFEQLLGVEAAEATDEVLSKALSEVEADGAQIITFALQGFDLLLAAPRDLSGGGALAIHLTQRGERPFLLRLRTSQRQRVGLLDGAMAHGVRIELI